MSLRDAFPKPRISRSHYFLTLARGDDIRCVALRPLTLYAFAGVVPLVAAIYFACTAYFVFHDRMLSALMTRQAEMQTAYEDRLAAMRAQVDRMASRQLLDQDSVENRVHELVARQAQLETRAVVVANLAEGAGLMSDTTPAPGARDGRTTVLVRQRALTGIGGPAATIPSFAPLESRSAPALKALERSITPGKPQPVPEPIEAQGAPPLRPGDVSEADTAKPAVPMALHLATVTAKLDRVERLQINSVGMIAAVAQRKSTQLRTALAQTGLNLEKLSAPRRTKDGPAKYNQTKSGESSAVGGPFVPLKIDPNGTPFEREVARLQDQIITADRIRQVLPYIPLRRPLSSVADVTSPFGSRVDPFFGRAAMHTGVDLREPYGAPVLVTAAGKVTSAGPNGGYGNMVEVDHGNGITTRYGHMSAILVSEGQWVEAGAVVGRLGSTGRSTGAHLHYEVRIDDEPVDPMRFLRAGARFFAQN
ncbi:peptidoglycan DD-metalloendopeptidase family protein [Roseiarcaceae bacterium H3SJ34-1]|uniref:M23 family metallopeptidase n=1 Tax=Terripilifer ovatus TaxID=3032367 RepID=UPI003AB984FE|nr:peptidoglycan DD-metalloendopeptidase family protein [Roseiarcaceae bacterium H3SJ34-1]